MGKIVDIDWLVVHVNPACINMDPPGEPGGVRLTKEGRIGPGGKLSSQESPCESVVGSR